MSVKRRGHCVEAERSCEGLGAHAVEGRAVN